MPMKIVPVGTILHNVELKPGKGGQIARAAGSYVQLVGRDQGYAILRLGSGEQRLVHADCFATVGAVSQSGPCQHQPGARPAGRAGWGAARVCAVSQ